MLVIAVANTKGGVGKTTLTASLAVRAAQESERVAMVDLDPQGSLVAWWKRRGGPENPAMLSGVDSAVEAIDRLHQTGWDYAFIDGPPAFLTVVQETIEVADFVLIPVKPSVLDMLATQDAVVLARKAGANFMAVLNDVVTADRSMAKSSRQSLLNHEIPVAKTIVYHRIAHIRGMTLGKSGPEVESDKERKAATEIDALWQEVKANIAKANQQPKAVANG